MAKAEDLDWDDLRYFLRAIQAKTIAGGARTLGVEHSTVGRRLAALERTLGAPLVLRGPDGLRLTRLGEKLAPLVENMDIAVRAMSEVLTSETSRVRLATPSGFTKLLAGSLPQLATEHPGIFLEIVSGAHAVDLNKGEADLAIRGGSIKDENLVARRLCDSGFSLYASEAYLTRRPEPIDVNDLSGHEIIGFEPALAQAPPARWVAEHSAGATIALRTREMTDVVSAALSGVGLAVLPCLLGDQEQGLTRLTPKVLISHPLSLVYRRELRTAESVRTVIHFVVTIIGKNASRIRGVSPQEVP